MKRFVKRMIKTFGYLDDSTQFFIFIVLLGFVSAIISKNVRIVPEIEWIAPIDFVINTVLIAFLLVLVLWIIVGALNLVCYLIDDFTYSYRMACEEENEGNENMDEEDGLK